MSQNKTYSSTVGGHVKILLSQCANSKCNRTLKYKRGHWGDIELTECHNHLALSHHPSTTYTHAWQMKRPANPTEYVVTSPSTLNFIRISSSIRVHQVLPVLAVVGNQILLRYPKPTHQHDYYKETHTHRVLQSDPCNNGVQTRLKTIIFQSTAELVIKMNKKWLAALCCENWRFVMPLCKLSVDWRSNKHIFHWMKVFVSIGMKWQ